MQLKMRVKCKACGEIFNYNGDNEEECKKALQFKQSHEYIIGYNGDQSIISETICNFSSAINTYKIKSICCGNKDNLHVIGEHPLNKLPLLKCKICERKFYYTFEDLSID